MPLTVAILADKLVEWAQEICPDLLGAYEYATARKTQPLPDIGVEIVATELIRNPPNFPNFQIQQVDLLKVYRFNLLLMVAPEPADTASAQLSGFSDALTAAVLSDSSLGGRVPGVSLDTRSSFNPPFVQFDDGTRGRLCTLELTVGEPVTIEE